MNNVQKGEVNSSVHQYVPPS